MQNFKMNEQQQQQQHGERYRESKQWENLGIEKVRKGNWIN